MKYQELLENNAEESMLNEPVLFISEFISSAQKMS